MIVPSQPWSLGDSPYRAGQRDGFVQFWLAAPLDQLDALWNSGFGITSRKLIEELAPDHNFTPEQVRMRNEIGERIDQLGLKHPLAMQLMLANFLLSPPGLITINNVETYFPNWFVEVYKSIYVANPFVTESKETSPSSLDSLQTVPLDDQLPPVPDLGPFPSTLQELVANRLQLNRLLGLANLYYIDPDDKDICSELLELRRNLVDAIIRCPESQLEQLWSTELGERYWALVRSGIQREPLTSEDLTLKHNAVTVLNPQSGGGFGSESSINAFLVVMLYFVPGSMKVDHAQQKIPVWLFSAYKEIFAQVI